MGILQFNSYGLASSFASSHNFNTTKTFKSNNTKHLNFFRSKIRAVGTIPGKESVKETETTTTTPQEPPIVNFAFVTSVLLPDGTPDMHLRKAIGGQKLRDIMLDSNIDLYGPYSRPLLNCGGGGTCATCMVEVVQGKELLSPRTDKEKEKLKRKPKNWRLACQTTVGEADSRGVLIIQQLPEWKGHEWEYGQMPPQEEEEEEENESS